MDASVTTSDRKRSCPELKAAHATSLPSMRNRSMPMPDPARPPSSPWSYSLPSPRRLSDFAPDHTRHKAPRRRTSRRQRRRSRTAWAPTRPTTVQPSRLRRVRLPRPRPPASRRLPRQQQRCLRRRSPRTGYRPSRCRRMSWRRLNTTRPIRPAGCRGACWPPSAGSNQTMANSAERCFEWTEPRPLPSSDGRSTASEPHWSLPRRPGSRSTTIGNTTTRSDRCRSSRRPGCSTPWPQPGTQRRTRSTSSTQR